MAASTLDNSRSIRRPAGNGDTFASGANEAIPQTNDRALPGGSARGRGSSAVATSG